jgi:hypothetical protein
MSEACCVVMVDVSLACAVPAYGVHGTTVAPLTGPVVGASTKSPHFTVIEKSPPGWFSN